MAFNLPRRARLFEFAAAAASIALVSLLLLDSLGTVQEEAERLAVEITIRNMNSGLYLEQAALLTAGREAELPRLVLRNPVDWLEAPPAGYIGATSCTAPGRLDPGQWSWDPALRQVCYRPRRADGLKLAGELPLLVWRVQAPVDPRAVRPGSIRVVPAVGYTWRP